MYGSGLGTRPAWQTVCWVFDSRLGQAIADAVSGTAEEIQRAVRAGNAKVTASDQRHLGGTPRVRALRVGARQRRSNFDDAT